MIERNQEIERIIDAAPDATVFVGPDGRLVIVNAQAEKLFGYRRDEMLGQPVEMLIPDRYGGAHAAHRKKFSAAPRVREMGVNLELFGRAKDGREFPVDVNLSPVELDGKRLIVAAVRDISRHQSIEEALRRARDEAADANRFKSRFLAAASHDLRQPLQSLGLYLSVLGRQIEAPQLLDLTSKMRHSLDVMGDMLDTLLDLSRLESGTITPEFRVLPVQAIFDATAAAFRAAASEKRLDFIVVDSPLVIRSDPQLLQRIIDNLVANAIRYTDKGSVTLRCCLVAGQVRLEVADTGIGIPEHARASIFEEYVQLGNPTRDRQKGLGLGLSIVRQIARLLDHELSVEDGPEGGSVFAVHVPQGERRPSTPEPRETATEIQAMPTCEVLLVEDDPAVLDATAMLLVAEGCTVRTAGSVAAALENVRNGACPDVIISDYRMPDSNGLDLIRSIRELLGKTLPAMLVTGDTAWQEDLAAGLPACTVLRKPVDAEALVAWVRQTGR